MRVLSVERVGVDACEGDNAVRRVRQPVVAFQRAGEQFEQAPADEDSDRHPARQRDGRLDQRPAADLCPELLAGQDQERDRGDVEGETDQLAGFLHPGLADVDDVVDVPDDRRDHVEDEDQPGEALSGRQRGGEQGQHERPREAGVGEVEDVVVDELARFLDEPPDAGRDAREEREGRDDADRPACGRRHPRVSRFGSDQRWASEGHRPRGYALSRRNGCDRYQTGPVCFSPGP